MAWYSLLPSHLTIYETWLIRTFLFLAILNISPWLLAIVYDLLLWLCRAIWHEVPLYGGRARGERRPRAPSLRERSRRLSMAELISGSGAQRGGSGRSEVDDLRRREHRRNISYESIEEEKSEDDAQK